MKALIVGLGQTVMVIKSRDLEGYEGNDDEVEGPAQEVDQLKHAKKKKGILTTIIPTTPSSSNFPFINSLAHNLLE